MEARLWHSRHSLGPSPAAGPSERAPMPSLQASFRLLSQEEVQAHCQATGVTLIQSTEFGKLPAYMHTDMDAVAASRKPLRGET